jgi:hypothetical protein
MVYGLESFILRTRRGFSHDLVNVRGRHKNFHISNSHFCQSDPRALRQNPQGPNDVCHQPTWHPIVVLTYIRDKLGENWSNIEGINYALVSVGGSHCTRLWILSVVWYRCDCVFYSSSRIRKRYRLEWSMRCRGSPRISFYSVLSFASGCHARFHLLFSTSMLCAVLLPVSFSSRFIRVIAAARPIDMAKMGSRRLFLVSGRL